jgi:hypothetical protein
MNLTNVEGAIEQINEEIKETSEVLEQLNRIRFKLESMQEKSGLNKALHDAGFNDTQIDMFFEILTK